MYSNNSDGVSVHDGFPNPATDASLQSLNLNQLLVQRPISTYFMRVQGNGWPALGIFAQDIVLVDRSLTPRLNDLVVWWHGDGFNISKLSVMNKQGGSVWGTVTATIHQYRN